MVMPLSANQDAATRTSTLLPVPVGAFSTSVGPGTSRIASVTLMLSVVFSCVNRSFRTWYRYRSWGSYRRSMSAASSSSSVVSILRSAW